MAIWGLETFNNDNTGMIRYTDRLTRYMGVAATGIVDGFITVPGSGGDVWLSAPDISTALVGTQNGPPAIWRDGNLIRWQFPDSFDFQRRSVTFYFGRF